MKIRAFLASESGAVQVDWVVMTAAIVVLASAIVIGLESSSVNLAQKTGVAIDGVF